MRCIGISRPGLITVPEITMTRVRRSYATDANVTDMFKKTRSSTVTRESSYDKRAGELIKAVQKGDYRKAEIMVLNENVNVNGHNRSENTALTDAAKRGDCKAIEFLITKLKANPHASCDCPDHKTALHYASENNHRDAVQLLLKLGANPNVMDSRKYKAIDVTTDKEIKQLLESSSRSQCMLAGLKKSQPILSQVKK